MTSTTESEISPEAAAVLARELARLRPGHHGAVVMVAGPEQGRFAHFTLCPDPTPATGDAIRPVGQA